MTAAFKNLTADQIAAIAARNGFAPTSRVVLESAALADVSHGTASGTVWWGTDHHGVMQADLMLDGYLSTTVAERPHSDFPTAADISER